MYRGASVGRASTPPRPPVIGGRWSLLPAPEPEPTLRATRDFTVLTIGALEDLKHLIMRGALR